jgi:hypothetical protein
VSSSPQVVDLVLTAFGPAGVWLAGATTFQTSEVGDHTFRVHLDQEVTPLLVRFERVAYGETAHAMALRVSADDVHVRIRSLIQNIGRRNAFERLASGVYVERDVYAGDTPIVLRWPAGGRAFCPAHVRLHGADDAIYALADSSGEADSSLELGFALQLPAGPLRVTLMPSPDEVYLQHTRIFVHVPVWSMGRQPYSAMSGLDLAARRTEALVAMAQYAASLFGQLARMALGAWDDVDVFVLLNAIEVVRERAHGSNRMLVGLLGMLYRWSDQARLSDEVRQALADAIVHYPYRADDILDHAAEVLAGQRFAEQAFGDGRTGAWHRDHAARLARNWMSVYGSMGSAAPGAPQAMADELVALTHLADLADDPRVYELAAVCSDKLLFTLALNSRQGVLGSAARSSPASVVKSGYLQPTAGISRLLWGTGIYNQHAAAVVSLACAPGYEPPPIIEAIAHDAPAALWSHERHAPPGTEPTEIDTYKTAEYILSSVRSFVPDSPGDSELAWRATLGPEAVVFANHPGSSSESDSRLPGYWAGNARRPRVGQWQDVLLAVHRVASDDVFGFTHAYFPCTTFDDYSLRHGWGFARVGDGYLALTNSRGVQLATEGRYALRELRAFGAHQTWLVQMGRAALDGDFLAFQTKVLAMPVIFGDDGVRCTTLRGDALSLTWTGPLLVNGAAQPEQRAQHFKNPYTSTDLASTEMEIRYGADYLRLDFSP